ncbi:Uncharacterised protein [Hafnia alvei]|uniref:Uncharacterized protein n=1 Tax=Hafnia alvei TaxID=569 RepID=A0A377PJK2_HAFAL|nr:Uncharacterised protein [Hafnia alvei]
MRTQRLILGLGAIILLLASPLALAQLPGIVSQPLANGGQKLVVAGSNAGFPHLFNVFARRIADDDQLYPHHHRVGIITQRIRHTVCATQSGYARAGAVSHLFRDVTGV